VLAAATSLPEIFTLRDLLFRPGRRVLGMGTDSLTVLLFYVISRAACSPSPPSNPPRSA